jgi:hypothetical protein
VSGSPGRYHRISRTIVRIAPPRNSPSFAVALNWGTVLAQPEMSFRAYGPRNPMKIAQSKIRAARSSEVEFSLDEVEAVEMSDPERA